jgi:hypothetical protein
VAARPLQPRMVTAARQWEPIARTLEPRVVAAQQWGLIDRPLELRVVAARQMQPKKVESSWTAFGVLPQRDFKAQSLEECVVCVRG